MKAGREALAFIRLHCIIKVIAKEAPTTPNCNKLSLLLS